MTAALSAAPAVSATVVTNGLRASVTYAGTRSSGHIVIAGRAVDFVVVGPVLYLSASSYDWTTYGGVGFAQGQTMGAQWFRTSTARLSSAPYAYLFARARVAAALSTAAGRARNVTFSTLRGRAVLAVHLINGRTLFASAAGSPRPVQLVTARASFGFSYGAPTVSIPPASPLL